MTGEVRKVINNRYKLLLRARKTPRESKEWDEYKKARKRCTNLIRFSKANYWKNKFSTADSPKSFWTLVKKFKGDSATQRTGPLKHKGVTMTNDIDKTNLMNNFFAGIGKKLATDITTGPYPPYSYIYCVTTTQPKIELSKQLLAKSFKSAVRIGKACGTDNIALNNLKLHEDSSITGLHVLVKCSLASEKFPTEWKRAKVTAIYKKGASRTVLTTGQYHSCLCPAK